MPEDKSIWVGRDEHHGVPAQQRKDLKPPPHWRLEAVAATARPRSLTVGADRRHVGLHRGRRDIGRLAARPRGRACPAAHHGPRSGPVLGGHRAAPVARRVHCRLRATQATSGSRRPPAVPRASSSRAAARSGSTTPAWSSPSSATTRRGLRWPTAPTPGPGAWPPSTATSTSAATRASRRSRRIEPRWPTPSRRAATSTAARSAWPTWTTGAVRALTGTPRMHDHSPGVVARRLRDCLRLGAQRLQRAARRRPRRHRRPPADGRGRRPFRGRLAPGRLASGGGPRAVQPFRPRLGRRRERQHRGTGRGWELEQPALDRGGWRGGGRLRGSRNAAAAFAALARCRSSRLARAGSQAGERRRRTRRSRT